MITEKTKLEINQIIFKRAYEIEKKLFNDNSFLAKMGGIKDCDIPNVALKCAVKELKKEFI